MTGHWPAAVAAVVAVAVAAAIARGMFLPASGTVFGVGTLDAGVVGGTFRSRRV